MTWQQLAESIVAVAILVLTASGVLTAAIPAIRRAVLDRMLGSAWYRITSKTRAEDHASARRERLRGAIGVLSEGLAMGLVNHGSQVKIAQAIAEFRSEGPADLKEHLDRIVQTVSARSHTNANWELTQAEIAGLLDPIIQRLRAELDRAAL